MIVLVNLIIKLYFYSKEISVNYTQKKTKREKEKNII